MVGYATLSGERYFRWMKASFGRVCYLEWGMLFEMGKRHMVGLTT